MSLSLAWDSPCLPSSNLLSFLSVLGMGGSLAVFCESHECWGYWHLLPLVGLIRTRLKVFLVPFTHNEYAPNFLCVRCVCMCVYTYRHVNACMCMFYRCTCTQRQLYVRVCMYPCMWGTEDN